MEGFQIIFITTMVSIGISIWVIKRDDQLVNQMENKS